MKGVLLIVLACSAWAVDTLIRYPLLGQVSAERIVFSEHLLLTVIFIPTLWTFRKKIWQSKVSDLFYFFVIGGLGSALATLAFTKAFGLINPSLVILLQKFQPVVAISLAAIVLKERIKKEFLLWAVVCVIGGILISFEDISQGLKGFNFSHSFFGHSSFEGYALTLLAVVSWGSATVFGKKLTLSHYDSKEIMAGRFLMGFICLLPLMWGETVELDMNFIVWGKIALMVGISGLLGMYFYYQGLKSLSARLCALAEMFFPFCAVAVNWLVLGKELGTLQIAGGLLLLLGSTVIQVKHY